MRTPSMLLVAVALSLPLTACSGESTTSPPQAGADSGADSTVPEDGPVTLESGLETSPDGPVTLGTVTLQFKNNESTKVYVDMTFGGALAITSSAHPEAYTLGTQCTDACPCTGSCVQCGAPQPTVKVLAPGEHLALTWSGTYYTFQSCSGSACQCHEAHVVAPGTFEAMLPGALGVTGGTPDPQDPTILLNAQLDETLGICAAKSGFTMNATPQTVEIPFACANP